MYFAGLSLSWEKSTKCSLEIVHRFISLQNYFSFVSAVTETTILTEMKVIQYLFLLIKGCVSIQLYTSVMQGTNDWNELI